MEVLFYLFSVIAIASTIGVILSVYPMYALLYLMISCLSISCIFFIVGAYFAGALEVIIYAGSVLVLFIFVMMLLNINFSLIEGNSLIVEYHFGKLLLLFIFLAIILCFMWNSNNDYFLDNQTINTQGVITLKSVGISLFSSYILLVEMASMLLLGALIISFHIGCFNQHDVKK